MKLSVVIPCYNAAQTIGVQLEALAYQTWNQPWEVIVVDNGSQDNSTAIIREFTEKIPNFKLIDGSQKSGASYARNLGVKNASGEAIAFCDADDMVAPDWVAAMGEALMKYDFVTGQNEHWKLNDPWLVKSFGVEAGDSGCFDHPFLPMAFTNNMGVKRSVHEAIGGFDENFYAIEDIDYSWRIQEAGYQLHDVPEALLHFRLRKTIPENIRRDWGVGFYEPLLYKKHQPKGLPKLLSWKSFIRTPIDFMFELGTLKIRNKGDLMCSLRTLAWRFGQLQGCLKFGFLPM